MHLDKILYYVKCPRDYGRNYLMEVRIAKLPDGSYLPSLCDGCDNMFNNATCNECMERMFQITLKDPFLKNHPQPIDPFST